MKKNIYLLICLAWIPCTLINAQDKPRKDRESKEQFMAMKIAFFTERIDLTAKEAEKFWPLYHEFEKDKAALHRERRRTFREYASEAEVLTDQQAREMIEEYLAFQKKDTQLDMDFYETIKTFLPPKKIMKLYITEIQFREHMLRKLRQGRNGNPQKKHQDSRP